MNDTLTVRQEGRPAARDRRAGRSTRRRSGTTPAGSGQGLETSVGAIAEQRQIFNDHLRPECPLLSLVRARIASTPSFRTGCSSRRAPDRRASKRWTAPGDEELEAILARIVRRTAKVLERLEEDFELDGAKDALAGIQAEQVQQRLRHPEPFEPTRRSAFLEGYSLHAGVRVHGNDLQGREQLCRYILRPPLALHRLSRSTDGALLYRMKRPRRGSSWLRLTPGELLAKLATLIPPPRVHGVRCHGVFARTPGCAGASSPRPARTPGPPRRPRPRPPRDERRQCRRHRRSRGPLLHRREGATASPGRSFSGRYSPSMCWPAPSARGGSR